MKPHYFYFLLSIMLLACNVQLTHTLEHATQETHPNGQHELTVPSWAQHSQTLRSCVLGAALDDTPIDFKSDDVQQTLQALCTQNIQWYNFVTKHFDASSEELAQQLTPYTLDALYDGLDYAQLLDLKGNFIPALSAHLVQRISEGLTNDCYATVAFLLTAHKKGANRSLLQHLEPRIHTTWTSLHKPVLLQHDGEYAITSARFSHDDSQIVTAAYDNTACIWDTHTGRLLHTLKGHTATVHSAEFNNDSTCVVTASEDQTARIWDAHTGNCLHILAEHTAKIKAAQFSPDGTRVVTLARDKTVCIWDAHTGTIIHILHTAGQPRSMRFNHGGSHVITGGGDDLQVWDISTGALYRTFEDPVSQKAQFSHGDSHVFIFSCAPENDVQLWNVHTGTLVYKFPAGDYATFYLATCFNHDGTRFIFIPLLQNSAHDVYVWDTTTKKIVQMLRGHTNDVKSARFSDDGTRIITTAQDNTARVWNSETGDLITIVHLSISNRHNKGLFSHDGSHIMVKTSDKNTVYVQNITPPPHSLAEGFLIKLITDAHEAKKLFDFNTPQTKALLSVFKNLNPAWKKILFPLTNVSAPELLLGNRVLYGRTAAGILPLARVALELKKHIITPQESKEKDSL